MKRSTKLSALFVQSVTRPGRHEEGPGGHGLSLLVKPRKQGGPAKSWSQRVRTGGQPVNICLGSYPVVTLAEAREAALTNSGVLRQGLDLGRKPEPPPTFEEAADLILEFNQKN